MVKLLELTLLVAVNARLLMLLTCLVLQFSRYLTRKMRTLTGTELLLHEHDLGSPLCLKIKLLEKHYEILQTFFSECLIKQSVLR